MLTVTDLCDYTWCPYSLYLKKVRHIRPPPTAAMVRGTIVHAVHEQCNRTEPALAMQEFTATSPLESIQSSLFRNTYQHAKNAILRHRQAYEGAGGDALALLADLKRNARYDSIIKAASFKKACVSHPVETAWSITFPPRRAELPLEDKALGLRGRIDAVEEPEPGIMIPIDYKTGACDGQCSEQHRLQVSAYSLLLETVYGCMSPMGIIVYTDSGRNVPIVVGQGAKAAVRRTIDASNKILFSKKEPEKKEGKKCSGCIYAPYCT